MPYNAMATFIFIFVAKHIHLVYILSGLGGKQCISNVSSQLH